MGLTDGSCWSGNECISPGICKEKGCQRKNNSVEEVDVENAKGSYAEDHHQTKPQDVEAKPDLSRVRYAEPLGAKEYRAIVEELDYGAGVTEDHHPDLIWAFNKAYRAGHRDPPQHPTPNELRMMARVMQRVGENLGNDEHGNNLLDLFDRVHAQTVCQVVTQMFDKNGAISGIHSWETRDRYNDTHVEDRNDPGELTGEGVFNVFYPAQIRGMTEPAFVEEATVKKGWTQQVGMVTYKPTVIHWGDSKPDPDDAAHHYQAHSKSKVSDFPAPHIALARAGWSVISHLDGRNWLDPLTKRVYTADEAIKVQVSRDSSRVSTEEIGGVAPFSRDELDMIGFGLHAYRMAHPDQSDKMDDVLRHVNAFIRECADEGDDSESSQTTDEKVTGGFIGSKSDTEEPSELIMGSELSDTPIITNEEDEPEKKPLPKLIASLKEVMDRATR